MSPGTGATGFSSFNINTGKLLSTTSFADPVYLNIPNELLSDIQGNAEYVSYALQYLYAMTGQQPAIVTWSQGSLDAQWAFKYWPSVPKIVTDHIAISPDYHGTSLAYILCPVLRLEIVSRVCRVSCSKSITRISSRSCAATAAIQPTPLPRPCTPSPTRSSSLKSAPLPLATSTMRAASVSPTPSCKAPVSPGLSLSDVIATEALIPLVALNNFTYLPKSTAEPAIKAYATY
jgi:hypothetical protein